MPGRLILAIDTAGPVAGLALLSGQRVEASWCARVVRGAEARLAPAVRELLQGRLPDAVAVTHGPGGFTGLRVGVATALGLAVAVGCPLVPVSSLRARAAMVWGHARVLALLDARKGRFYGGLYDARPIVPVLIGEEGDLPLERFIEIEPALAVGEGAAVSTGPLEAAGHRVFPLPDSNAAPALARVAALLAAEGLAIPPHEFQIRYLRPPDAKPPPGVSLRPPR